MGFTTRYSGNHMRELIFFSLSSMIMDWRGTSDTLHYDDMLYGSLFSRESLTSDTTAAAMKMIRTIFTFHGGNELLSSCNLFKAFQSLLHASYSATTVQQQCTNSEYFLCFSYVQLNLPRSYYPTSQDPTRLIMSQLKLYSH